VSTRGHPPDLRNRRLASSGDRERADNGRVQDTRQVIVHEDLCDYQQSCRPAPTAFRIGEHSLVHAALPCLLKEDLGLAFVQIGAVMNGPFFATMAITSFTSSRTALLR